MKRETFIAGMATLGATFGRPLEDAALEGYWIGLSRIEDAEFLQAMRMAIETNTFMPVPAELLAFARKERDKLQRLEALNLAERVKLEIAGPAPLRAIGPKEKP